MIATPHTSSDESLTAYRLRARTWLAEHAGRHGWTRERGSARSPNTDENEVRRAKLCQKLLHENGYAGISWPTEYGGHGLGLPEQVAFNVEAAAYALPVTVFLIGLGMCGPTILALGSDDQKQRYLPPMLRGEQIWCQLFSEPGAGSDVAGLRTRATRDGDRWIIDGQKIWTSGAAHCDYGLLLARTDAAVPKHRGITMFVVDMTAPGITVRPIRQMDGGSRFNEVFFDSVPVPAVEVIGGVGQGWQAATTTLANERVSLGAVRALDDVPSARTLIEVAKNTGRAADPRVRQDLVEVWLAERTVNLLGDRITTDILTGQLPGPQGSVAKLVRTQHARLSARLGAALAGPAAFAWSASDDAADRWAQNLLFVPSLSIAGGTDEILRNIIGERVLGLPKEPQVDRDLPFKDIVGREQT